MRLYSYFDTFELYNTRRSLGKFFFGFFASLFSFRRSLAAFLRAARAWAWAAAYFASPSSGLRSTRPGFEYTLRELFEVRPSQTAPDAPIVRSTAAAIERVLGRVAEHVVSPGTYDQKHIDRIGRMKNCIAYGPGLLHLAHQPDEWVGVQDMEDSALVMALVLADLLG